MPKVELHLHVAGCSETVKIPVPEGRTPIDLADEIMAGEWYPHDPLGDKRKRRLIQVAAIGMIELKDQTPTEAEAKATEAEAKRRRLGDRS